MARPIQIQIILRDLMSADYAPVGPPDAPEGAV